MSRLRIRRRPLVYWSLTGALALVTVNVVVYFVLAESIPKTYAVLYPDRAALLTAREDLPTPAVEHPDLSPLAATVQNNIALPSEAKKTIAAKKKPAPVETAPATMTSSMPSAMMTM